jgi:nitrogen fixation protein FixH
MAGFPTAMTEEDASANGIKGRHVLWAMIGFFGLIFAVNGVMVYLALSTYSGLVANEPYRKGLDYNERIVADERQAKLGWTADAAIDRRRIVVTVNGKDGEPLAGLVVSGRAARPASARSDRSLEFKEISAGRYAASLGDATAGTWQIDIELRQSLRDVRQEDAPRFQLRRRLWLEP